MSNDKVVINVENVSKRYFVGHESIRRDTLRDTLVHYAKNFGRKALDMARGHQIIEGDEVEEFWALRNVSLEVERGEVIGIIGRNGAGKSTLLKILSRITEPSEGRVTIDGRVASLLEVGTGFHPELTGRENIYLNGTILGMTRAEIKRKFDEIIAFAGVARFLDTPVKRYSSGMYVRLAFAVAAHLEPEILIVDEVLAVGDTEFQRKCLGKMSEVAGGGRTVLFVSHNMSAVKALCDRSALLVNGTIDRIGPTEAVITTYLESTIPEGEGRGRIRWAEGFGPGEEDFRLLEVYIRGAQTAEFGSARADEPVEFGCIYRQATSLRDARVVFQLLGSSGDLVFASTDHSERLRQGHEQSGVATYKSACSVPSNLLKKGSYVVRVRVGVPGSHVLVPDTDACRLQIYGKSNHGSDFDEAWPGIVCPRLEWSVRKVVE